MAKDVNDVGYCNRCAVAWSLMSVTLLHSA